MRKKRRHSGFAARFPSFSKADGYPLPPASSGDKLSGCGETDRKCRGPQPRGRIQRKCFEGTSLSEPSGLPIRKSASPDDFRCVLRILNTGNLTFTDAVLHCVERGVVKVFWNFNLHRGSVGQAVAKPSRIEAIGDALAPRGTVFRLDQGAVHAPVRARTSVVGAEMDHDPAHKSVKQITDMFSRHAMATRKRRLRRFAIGSKTGVEASDLRHKSN